MKLLPEESAQEMNPPLLTPKKKNKRKEGIIIKPITRDEINILVKNDIIRNTNIGYVAVPRGYKNKKIPSYLKNHTGYYRTCGKKVYMEDAIVNLARRLLLKGDQNGRKSK